MSRISFIILLISVLSFTTSCNKCKGDAPRVKISNNGTNDAKIIITTPDGKTEIIDELEKGHISDEKTYVEGNLGLTYIIANKEVAETVSIKNCNTYNITINSDDELIIFSKEKK